MSKLGCICGHTITDQTDAIPYKGHIIRDVIEEPFLEKLYGIIDSLIDAIKNDQREKWVKDNFHDSYPLHLKNSDMVHDLFIGYYLDQTRDIYQCENCGRILIQVGTSQNYATFKPESGNWKNILGNEAGIDVVQ